jgi:F-type H+-transporting ATPase subunit gamma
MGNLKEIRARINSVASTEKITSAMKMVSAAKLKKSEGMTLNFLPYRNKLSEALANYLGSLEEEVTIPLAAQREVQRVTLIAFSSSNGLCGVYNSSIIKLFRKTYDEYTQQLGADNVEVILFGKKINEYVEKSGIHVDQKHESLSEHLSFEKATELSDQMVQRFLDRQTDRVVLIYNHHKNAGVQIPTCEIALPLETNAAEGATFDYLVEPSKEEFINALVPKVIRTKFYSIMLDTFTAEHGARMTAMHIASDNAASLLQELRQQYNKARQNVITTELIDIVGGAEALNK